MRKALMDSYVTPVGGIIKSMLSTILFATVLEASPRDYLADVVKVMKTDWRRIG